MTPTNDASVTVEQCIAEAIAAADAGFSYSFNLTRLVDGEETRTLTMPGFEPVDFEDRYEGYAVVAERRNAVRAQAVLAALASAPAGDAFAEAGKPIAPAGDSKWHPMLLTMVDALHGDGGEKTQAIGIDMSYQQALAIACARATAVPGRYLVWSNEHRAWWGPDGRGYTRHVHKAGRYDRAKALEISTTRGGGWPEDGNPYEIMALEGDAIAMVERRR